MIKEKKVNNIIFKLDDEDYRLWRLMAHVERASFKTREKELSRYHLSSPEAAVLFAVRAIGTNATPAEISRWVLREPHTVSHLLQSMEDNGLIRKVKDLERKNQVRIELTAAGMEAYEKSAKRDSIHKLISCLSEKEREQIWKLMRKLLSKALEDLGMDSSSTGPFPYD